MLYTINDIYIYTVDRIYSPQQPELGVFLQIKNSLEQCQDSTCTYMVQFPGLETPEYLPNGLQV